MLPNVLKKDRFDWEEATIPKSTYQKQALETNIQQKDLKTLEIGK